MSSENDLTNKLLISKFHQILILIFLSPSIHDIQLWACFTQFGDNVPEFWKINQRIRFDLLKIKVARSVEVSTVFWSRYLTLKRLWRTLENYVIKEPMFHTFLHPFFKNFVILLFRNTKTGITLDLDLTLICNFFWKSHIYFWKIFHLTK